MTIAGILLTGGASRRMGTDKATLVVRGEALAARAARVLSEVCVPVIEVGAGVSALPCVREEPIGAGPVAAVVAGADALGPTDAAVLVLACDLPFVQAPLLRLLAEWPGRPTALPIADGRRQLVCARYGPGALAAMRSGVDALHAALARCDTNEIDELDEAIWSTVAPANAFVDVDTPADLADLGLL
jgi:molybdopterin-guanine dinucleotide biosynthesis protein A